MRADLLFYAMLAHVVWVVGLYGLLTLARAPSVWGVGTRRDGSNPWAHIEPRVSANLSNQFEWPLFFHIVCVILLARGGELDRAVLILAGVFLLGRVVHSAVQIFTSNVRLRGVVFTINFLAVLGLWSYVI